MFRLSISNIAWETKEDTEVYNLIKEYGFAGLEIAPTRIIPSEPYEHNAEAMKWAKEIMNI